MTLDEVLSGRVAIWGLGQEGLSLAGLALERGSEPLLVDDRPEDAAPRAAAVLGGNRPVRAPAALDWAGVDVLVRSPGVSRYRPELAVAEAAGTRVTTAMAMWLEDFGDARIVAVTGTKGKSTTATLAAAVLAEDGWKAELIGNIGVPVVETYRHPRADLYVVEVSSYQSVDVTRSPGVVVLTGLAPDHLDWHGGIEAYYRDKLRLFEAGPPGTLAVSAASPEAVRRTASHPSRTLYGPEGRVRVSSAGMIEIDGVTVADGRLFRVPGRHNLWNLCGALSGVLLATGRSPSSSAIGAALDGFEGLPSRCRTIGERSGRTYVDDALASNPSASAASVETFGGRPLTVIVGGADRGVDPEPLLAALGSHRPAVSVVVVPPDPERLAGLVSNRLGPGGVVRVAGDLSEAVALAGRETPAGGVVLFSPGAPTPEGGGGYRARSQEFADAAGLVHGPAAPA